MAPDAVEMIEIRGAIPQAVRVVPERHWHTRKRLRADQFTRFADDRIAVLVPHLHRHPESDALQFSAIHRQGRRAQREAGDQVRATADAAQAHILRDRALHPVVRMLGQRTAGAEDHIQRTEIVILRRYLSEFLRHRQKLRAGAEVREFFLGGKSPQDVRFARRNR